MASSRHSSSIHTDNNDALHQAGAIERLKTSVFLLLHALAEPQTHKRVTAVSQLFAVLILVFDAWQRLVLLVRSQYGFHADVVEAMQSMSARHVLFGGSWLRVIVTVGVTCALVWTLAALMFDARRRLLAGSPRDAVQRQLHVCRAFIPVLVTCGSTVVLDITTAVLSCSEMRVMLGDEWECFTTSHVAVIAAAVATLIVFVPVAFTIKLLYHQSDPNAAEVMGMSSGFGDASDFMVTLVVAVAALIAYRLPAFMALVSSALSLLSLYWTATRLPFFHHLINPLQCCLQAARGHVAVGAFVMSAVDPSPFTLSLVWLCVTPLLAVLGAALPRWQWARVQRVLKELRPRMLMELHQHRIQVGRTNGTASGAGVGGPITGTSTHGAGRFAHVVQRRQNIEQLAARATETRYRAARLPLGEDDDEGHVTPEDRRAVVSSHDMSPHPWDGSPMHQTPVHMIQQQEQQQQQQQPWGKLVAQEQQQQQQQEATEDAFRVAAADSPFASMSAYEAELVVRAELSLPGNTDVRKRRRRFGRTVGSVPTIEAVEHSMWLYAEAMNVFAEDAMDIARVKIEYARFLQVYTEDVNLATGALEGALRERPTIEGEYQVFARTQRLQTKRQNQNQDPDTSMNQMALMDYSKRLRAALHSHSSALVATQKLLITIHRQRATLLDRADSMANRLGTIVARIAHHSAEADQQYRRLLVTHAGAPGLAKIYARFSKDVLKQRANFDAMSVSGTSVGDTSSDGGSSSGNSAHSSSSVDANAGPQLRPIRTSREVVRIDTHFRVATVALVALIIAMMFVTSSFVDTTDTDIVAIHTAGDLRYHLVGSVDAVRQASLLASNASSVTTLADTTRAELAVFKGKMLHVYRHVATAGVVDLLDTFNVPARVYSTNDTWYERTTNTWTMLQTVVADVDAFVHAPAAYHDNKHWRFVMDNSILTVMPRLHAMVALLDKAATENLFSFEYVQFALLGVMAIVLAFMGIHVFGGALKRVKIIKRGVVDIAAHLPPLTLSRMRRNAAKGIAFVRRARVRALQAVNDAADEEADRGIGPVTNFTYDADVDGPSPAPTSPALSPAVAATRGSPRVRFEAGVGQEEEEEEWEVAETKVDGMAPVPGPALKLAPPHLSLAPVRSTNGAVTRLGTVVGAVGPSFSSRRMKHVGMASPHSSAAGSPLSSARVSPSPRNTDSPVHRVTSSHGAMLPAYALDPAVPMSRAPLMPMVREASMETDDGDSVASGGEDKGLSAVSAAGVTPTATTPASSVAYGGQTPTGKPPTGKPPTGKPPTGKPPAGRQPARPSQSSVTSSASFASHINFSAAPTAVASSPCARGGLANLPSSTVEDESDRDAGCGDDDDGDSTGTQEEAKSSSLLQYGSGQIDKVRGTSWTSVDQPQSRGQDNGGVARRPRSVSDPVPVPHQKTTLPPGHPPVPAALVPETQTMTPGASGPGSGGGCPVVGRHVIGKGSLRRRGKGADPGANPPLSSPDKRRTVRITAPPPSTSPTRGHGAPPVEELLRQSPGAVVCTDAIGTILYVNDMACDTTGYERHQLLGQNVTMLQDADLASRHHAIMQRVVDGGTPQVIGKAGRQLALIQADGEPRPVLLALNRLEVNGATYFVADMADISEDVVTGEDTAMDENAANRGSRSLLARVLLALFFIALLQGGNLVFGTLSLATLVTHSSEVAHSNDLRQLARLMAFTCREAAIGDGELWTPTAATEALSDQLSTFSTKRFAIRFGDASLGLPGSSGVSEAQDSLQFGTVKADGSVWQGLDAIVAFYERHVEQCVRAYQSGTASVGPDIVALAQEQALQDVEATAYGDMQGLLLESEQLFQGLTHKQASRVTLVDRLVVVFNSCFVVALYIFVFRPMVRVLLSQAQWTEHFLVLVPRELGASGPLKKYFERVSIAD